jgi:hypothetical protein
MASPLAPIGYGEFHLVENNSLSTDRLSSTNSIDRHVSFGQLFV